MTLTPAQRDYADELIADGMEELQAEEMAKGAFREVEPPAGEFRLLPDGGSGRYTTYWPSGYALVGEQTMIYHDADRFESLLRLAISENLVIPACDVVTRDGKPEDLLLVIQDDVTWEWVSDGETYRTYGDALFRLGTYLDKHNVTHRPISDRWIT